MIKNNLKLSILLFLTLFLLHHTLASQASDAEINEPIGRFSSILDRLPVSLGHTIYTDMFPRLYMYNNVKKDNCNRGSVIDNPSNGTESIFSRVEIDKENLLKVIEHLTTGIAKGCRETFSHVYMLITVLQDNHRHVLFNLIPESLLTQLLQHGNYVPFYDLIIRKLDAYELGKPEPLYLQYQKGSCYTIGKNLTKSIVSDQFYQELCSANFLFPDVSLCNEVFSKNVLLPPKGYVAGIFENYHKFNLKLIKAMSKLDESTVMRREKPAIDVARYHYFCTYYSNPLYERNEIPLSHFIRTSKVSLPNDVHQKICCFLLGCMKKNTEPIDPLICDKILKNSKVCLKKFDDLDEKHDLFLAPCLLATQPSIMEKIDIEMLLGWYRSFLHSSRLKRIRKIEKKEEDTFEWEIHTKSQAILDKFDVVFHKFIESNEERMEAWTNFQEQEEILEASTTLPCLQEQSQEVGLETSHK